MNQQNSHPKQRPHNLHQQLVLLFSAVALTSLFLPTAASSSPNPYGEVNGLESSAQQSLLMPHSNRQSVSEETGGISPRQNLAMPQKDYQHMFLHLLRQINDRLEAKYEYAASRKALEAYSPGGDYYADTYKNNNYDDDDDNDISADVGDNYGGNDLLDNDNNEGSINTQSAATKSGLLSLLKAHTLNRFQESASRGRLVGGGRNIVDTIPLGGIHSSPADSSEGQQPTTKQSLFTNGANGATNSAHPTTHQSEARTLSSYLHPTAASEVENRYRDLEANGKPSTWGTEGHEKDGLEMAVQEWLRQQKATAPESNVGGSRVSKRQQLSVNTSLMALTKMILQAEENERIRNAHNIIRHMELQG